MSVSVELDKIVNSRKYDVSHKEDKHKLKLYILRQKYKNYGKV